MPDNRTQTKEILLNGKWTTDNPVGIGANFQTLKNLRPTDTHLKGVQGMSKINTTALVTYLKTRSAFHFTKSQPAESHVLIQAFNAGLTASQILENVTAIPSAGDFSATALWTDSSGALTGRFSNAPDGKVIYANGVDNCIWGGNESSVGAFITSTAAITDTAGATNPRDYTDVVNNTKQDSENVAVIGGGVDAYTGLLVHGNGVDAATGFADSATAGAAKTVTAVADAQVDTSWAKYGTGSVYLDGTGDGLTTADHADFYAGTSALTYDKWIRIEALPDDGEGMVLYSQRASVSDEAVFYLRNISGTYSLVLMLVTSGAAVYPIGALTWATPVINTKYHIALIRGWGASANVWTVTINGTSLGSVTTSTTYPNVAAAFNIGLGTSEVVSFYPAGQSDTYVKTTTKFGTDYWPYYATDPSKSLTGAGTGVQWLSENGVTTNQRFHIDLGVATVVKRIYYENAHSSGSDTDIGVKNFTFWGSNTAGSFAELTYGTDTGWTQLTTSQATFDQHTGSDASDKKYITVTNSTAYRYYAFKFADNYGDATCIGVRRIELNPVTLVPFQGWMDEIRWSHTAASGGIARWTANFTPWSRPYSPAARYWLLGSPLPLKGCKYYISNGNGVASTLTGKVWNGHTWATMTVTDNTDTGASLATTGTVTFASTVDVARAKYLEGYFLYWYQFSIDAGEAEIYHVTVDAPFQDFVDIWDGVYRKPYRFYKYTTAYDDLTTNVMENDYSSGDAATYADLSVFASFSSGRFLEIGFEERMAGLMFMVVGDYKNTTADTVMAIDYWNGTEYIEVGTITDGTASGNISLYQSGVVSWNHNFTSDETKKVVSNSPPLYYYRVRFDKTMDDSVRVNYVGGVTAQKTISHYKFPVFAQGRILLCCDMAGEKNKCLVSGKYLPQAMNGDDSTSVYFGEEGELTCGIELFSQFGSSLYSLVLMFKDNEFWIMAGQELEDWSNNIFMLSSSIGCPAPMSLKTINLAVEPGAGINRNLAVWQGSNGIYMSDGRAPIPIHKDINAYFDPQDSRCIKTSMIGESVGWIDPVKPEYHLLVASGSSATSLNTELVYDIHRNKWFEIDRTADLQFGMSVSDTYGNVYTYGFLDTGYMERLENGTTFDGNAIVHEFRTGDMALAGLAMATQIDRIRQISVSKTTTTNSITCTHYADGKSSGTTFTLSPKNSGYNIAQPKITDKLDADPFHSIDMTLTTTDESIGYEPYAVVITYHPITRD